MSVINSEIWKPKIEITIKTTNRKETKQTKTARLFGIFLRSIQLQNGKNKVAKMPPIHNGIKKSLAKYNPAKIKKSTNNFFMTDDSDVVIIYVFLRFCFQSLMNSFQITDTNPTPIAIDNCIIFKCSKAKNFVKGFT